MKNAMKKLLSLALVAMLLVSVVPMGAMAAEDDLAVFDDAVPFANTAPSKDIPVQVYINDAPVGSPKTLTITGWDPVTLDESLARSKVSDWTNRTFVKWTNNSGEDVTGKTLKNGKWLDSQTGYSLNLYLKQVDPAPNSKSVTVYVMENNTQISTEKITVAGGGVTLNANLLPISGYKFVKWAVDGNKDVTGNSYVVKDCPNALYLYVEKDGSGSGDGGSGSSNTMYRYCVTYYDANGNQIGDQLYYETKANSTVTIEDKHYTIGAIKIDGGKVIDRNHVQITSDMAKVNVYPSGDTTNPVKWQYSVTVYDWNRNVIQNTTWYDATPNQNVVIQANNFYEMKVNGVKMGQGVNTFTIAKDETQVEVLTTTNSGNKPTDPTASYIDVIVKVDGSTKVNTSVKAQSATVNELLKKTVGDNWASIYKIDYWTQDNSNVKYYNVEGVVNAGQRVTVELIGGTSKHNTNKVMLHVFLNGNTSTVYASYNITGDLAQDYTVSYDEVKSYLMNRYKAKTDAGLDLDGLYYVTGNWVGNYFQDNKARFIEDLDMKLENGYVHINVMLNNATAKTSSNADTSNPKTGDDIYMAVTVMGLSAAALCAVYYISKKRAVR